MHVYLHQKEEILNLFFFFFFLIFFYSNEQGWKILNQHRQRTTSFGLYCRLFICLCTVAFHFFFLFCPLITESWTRKNLEDALFQYKLVLKNKTKCFFSFNHSVFFWVEVFIIVLQICFSGFKVCIVA